MSRWRERRERREKKADRSDPGRFVRVFVLGILLSGGLLFLGVYCFVAEAIPFEVRGGTVWVTGRAKTGWGVLITGVAVALHAGFVWSRVSALRPWRSRVLVAATAAAMTGFYLFL